MQIVNPLEIKDWDAQLLKRCSVSRLTSALPQDLSPQPSTIFHSAAWARVLHDTYGFNPCYLVDGPKLLPVMESKSRLTGRRGVSLPFTDECEPLGLKPEEFQECLKQLSEYGRERNWKYWELRGGEPFMNGVQPSVQFYTHILNLVPPSDPTPVLGHIPQPASDSQPSLIRPRSSILGPRPSDPTSDLQPLTSAISERFDASVRRAIRKAEKSDVKVEVSQTEASMKEFYRLQCNTRQKHGLPPQPWSFFQNIHRHLIENGLGFLVLASRGQASLAASLYLVWEKQAVYKFGASDERFQEFRGSNLVMWKAIQRCIEKGLAALHFGRTSLANDGLRRFKLGWGPTEEWKLYYKFDLRKNTYVTDTDRASGWHNRVFRKMPQPLLRLAGRILYPHMA